MITFEFLFSCSKHIPPTTILDQQAGQEPLPELDYGMSGDSEPEPNTFDSQSKVDKIPEHLKSRISRPEKTSRKGREDSKAARDREMQNEKSRRRRDERRDDRDRNGDYARKGRREAARERGSRRRR